MKNRRRRRSTYTQAKTTEQALREDAAAYGVDCSVVNVREAKDQLSALLDRASSGEQIVITSDGRPKAMIMRYRPMIQGAKWTSRRALRAKTPVSEDSARILRELRDGGH
jgi:prevent-host-death family protein